MKKLLGIIMLLVGSILVILTILTLVQLGARMPNTNTTNKAYFLVGYLGGVLLIGVPAFFLIKYGIKKIKEQDKIY